MAPVDNDLPGVRKHDASEDVHEGGLPGAILANKRVDLPCVEAEIHAPQGRLALEGLPHVLHVEDQAVHTRALVPPFPS